MSTIAPICSAQDETLRSNCAPSDTIANSTTRFAHSAILVVAVFAVFGRVLGYGFVSWDDTTMVTANPLLHPVDRANLLFLWSHAYYGLYAPLTYTVYSLAASISHLIGASPRYIMDGGLDPIPFHALSLTLHAACVLVVYQILLRLTGNERGSLLGALLFGLDPIQVEPVAWIGSLDTVLSGLFSLLSILLYVRHCQIPERELGAPPGKDYALASLFFLLALLSKPSAAALPLVAAVIGVGFLHRRTSFVLKEMGAWLVVSMVFALLTLRAQPFSASSLGPLWTRPFVAGDALAFYLTKLVLPFSTSPDYGRSPHWLLQHSWAYWTWILPAFGAALAWCARRQRPQILTCAALWLAALVPVLGLAPFAFQLDSTVADRYLYLAMLAPACAVGFYVPKISGRAGLAASCVLLAFAATAAADVGSWRSSTSLFSHAVSVSPQSPAMHYDLGDSLERDGDVAGAASEFRTAIALDPAYAEARCNLAGLLAARNQTTASAAQYSLAISSDPSLWQARDGLAIDLAQLGRLSAAIEQWKQALEVNPQDEIARTNLAVAEQTLRAKPHADR
jgi:protein O-mannosyl-transferase